MISIVIPVLNEEAQIKQTLDFTTQLSGNFEIIVVDGGSTDGTKSVVKSFSNILLVNSQKGRANQMNTGAKQAKGEILLFLHADTRLPENAIETIEKKMSQNNVVGGSFSLCFDSPHHLLRFYAKLSKINHSLFTYGDHAIFIKKYFFEQISGYKEISIMEDVEIQSRLRKRGKFIKLSETVLTSARRFKENGTTKQLVLDVLILVLYHLGVSPKNLKKWYPDNKPKTEA